MSSTAASTVPAGNIFRRFRRNRHASAAVEFALVAPVFFALLFAIIETGIVFLAGQVLETITQSAGRQIMTGQAQTAGMTQTQFQQYVCSQIPALFTCANVYIDVENYPAFTAFPGIGTHIDAGGNFINNMQYSPGGAGAVVVVQLFYQWPMFVTGLGYNITNLSGSKRLLQATAVFRNEPY
jgi:Flp pilus assembly protein TadG